MHYSGMYPEATAPWNMPPSSSNGCACWKGNGLISRLLTYLNLRLILFRQVQVKARSDISSGSHAVDAHKGVQKLGEGAFKDDQPL